MFNVINLKTLSSPFIECKELNINAGEVIKLNGPSGIGKSTFLKAIANLKSVSFDQFDFDRVIYLAQIPLSSILTVNEYVNKINNFKSNKNKQINLKLIENLNLNFLKSKKINELSGGQKQIISVSIALELGPKVLLIDEAISGIDLETQNKIMGYIKKYHKDIAIIFTAHSKTALDAFITKQLHMNIENEKVYVRPIS